MAAVKAHKNPLRTAVVLALVMVGCAYAQEGANPASFVAQPLSSAGAALLSPFKGGAYVYGPDSKDSRPTMSAFAVGKAPRDSFEYFSAQEEEALWNLQQDFLDETEREEAIAKHLAQRKARAAAKHRQPKPVAAAALDWPRVVVNGASICVPVLSFADAADWRDHLVCWNNGEVK